MQMRQEAEHLALRVDQARVRARRHSVPSNAKVRIIADDHAQRGPDEQEDRELRCASARAAARPGLRLCSGSMPPSVPPRVAPVGHTSIARAGAGACGRARQGRSGSRSDRSARVPEARMRPAAAASVHCSSPGRERDPGRGIRLDDVRRRAAGVARTLDHLDGAERRHAHLDAVPGAFSASSCSRYRTAVARSVRAAADAAPAARTAASAARPSVGSRHGPRTP